MRHVISGSLIAAALGTALIVAGIFPASAQVARPQSALATGAIGSADLLTLVQNRDRGGRDGGGRSGGRAERGGGGDRSAARGDRSGGRYGIPVTRGNSKYTSAGRGDGRGDGRRWRDGRRWDRGDWRWRHRYGYRYRGYPYWGTGFAVGLAAAAPYYAAPRYYAGDDAVAYCMSRFRSYDPASGTYLGYDGYRHPCP